MELFSKISSSVGILGKQAYKKTLGVIFPEFGLKKKKNLEEEKTKFLQGFTNF